jgi:hypothetical protein
MKFCEVRLWAIEELYCSPNCTALPQKSFSSSRAAQEQIPLLKVLRRS